MRFVIEARPWLRKLPWVHYVRLFGITGNAASAEVYPNLEIAKLAIKEWRSSDAGHEYKFTLTKLRDGLSVAKAVMCSEEIEEGGAA